MKTTAYLSAALLVVTVVSTAWADPDYYTETYDDSSAYWNAPTTWAAIEQSPYGVTYDRYYGRAFTRIPPPAIVIGTGDEKWYWGDNPTYSGNDTGGFILNGYGTGHTASGTYWQFGISFLNPANMTQPLARTVQSVRLDSAPGSHSPALSVDIIGMTGGSVSGGVVVGATEAWRVSVDLQDPNVETVPLPDGPNDAVTRIEIERTDGGYYRWYTLDDLTFDITGMSSPGAGPNYVWEYYTPASYAAATIPLPTSVILGVLGLGLAGRIRRRFA